LCLADWQPDPLCQDFTTRPRFGGVFVFHSSRQIAAVPDAAKTKKTAASGSPLYVWMSRAWKASDKKMTRKDSRSCTQFVPARDSSIRLVSSLASRTRILAPVESCAF